MTVARRLLLSATVVTVLTQTTSASAAPGDVTIAPKRVIVEATGGRAVIERVPLRISFLDANGRLVLRQVAGGVRRPHDLPPTRDPEPFALEREPDNASYAPLGFELGVDERAQWNAGFWNGNLLFSRRSGTVHSAGRVLSLRRTPRGVTLTVSTTAPGRRLIVRVERDRGDSLRVRVRPTPAQDVSAMSDSFVATPREGYYGFGGRHGSVNKRGEKLYGWVEQENLGGEPTIRGGIGLLPGLIESGSDYTLEQLGPLARIPQEIPGGFERYMAPGGPNGAYYPQAQFISSRGFGFLLNRPELVRWRMANDRRDAWQVHVASAALDYTVSLGPGRRQALRTLTAIGGRHLLPPAWAQRPMLSRVVSVPPLPGLPATETRESYRTKVEQDLVDMRRFGVRPGAYAFEGWALLDDLDYVRSVIRRLRARGVRAVVYHRAYVSDDALATQPRGDYEETRRLGLVATDASDQPFEFGSNGGAPATLLDFTKPATVSWWKRRLELLLDAGADGFMQDFGEQVQEGMRFADGSTGRTMHNRYPVLWHRVSRRIVNDWARRHPRRGAPWFFTRAGYSGRPGSAAYEEANFPGDETVDWNAGSGLRSLAPDMLNRGVGGAFGYATDIGGYFDVLTGPPSEELFNRWTEWAALTPYFRVHNAAAAGGRMPWSYGASTLRRWKAAAALHDRATPLIRRLWRSGRRTGVPPAAPLWLVAPEAPGAHSEAQQWLLGRDVLVAPVVHERARTRAVSLPRGCWRLRGAGRRFRGPGRISVRAPLGRLPYFFRCGTKPF